MWQHTAERHNICKIADIEILSHGSTDSIDASVCKNYIQHVENLQEEDSVKQWKKKSGADHH
jgi:hypothetical protein